MRHITKTIDGDVETLKDYKIWSVFYFNNEKQSIKVDDSLYKLKEAEEICHIVLDTTDDKEINNFYITTKDTVYTDFKEELKNLATSREIRKFFMLLDLEKDNINKYDDIVEKAQKGYCEDLAVYFFFKYRDIDIKIININRKHHVMYYDGLYYDSKTLNGVKEIKEIPFFKNTNIVDIHNWDESELPIWYREKWDMLNNKG